MNAKRIDALHVLHKGFIVFSFIRCLSMYVSISPLCNYRVYALSGILFLVFCGSSLDLPKEQLFMNCTRCGYQLPEGALACPNCGTPTAAYYAGSGSNPYTPTAIAQTPYYQQQSAPPYGAANEQKGANYGYDPHQAPSPPNYNAPAYPQINPYSPSHPYGSYSAPPSSPVEQMQYVVPQPPPQQKTPTPRSRSRLWIVVGVVTLVVAVIVSGLFALLPRGSTDSQAGTATLAATSTSNVSANPYSGGGTLVLDDPLKDNSKGYKWDEGTLNNNVGISHCTFSNGAYHTTITPSKPANSSGLSCNPEASSLVFSNVAFEVKTDVLQGSTSGVIVRVDQAPGNYYTFTIDTSGNYFFNIYSNNTPKLLTSGSNAIINKGLNQTNLVAIVAKGQTISGYVNGQFLASVDDKTYGQGQIGVYGGGTGNVDVAMTNARVWKLP